MATHPSSIASANTARENGHQVADGLGRELLGQHAPAESLHVGLPDGVDRALPEQGLNVHPLHRLEVAPIRRPNSLDLAALAEGRRHLINGRSLLVGQCLVAGRRSRSAAAASAPFR
jgi:hypothetical protein